MTMSSIGASSSYASMAPIPLLSDFEAFKKAIDSGSLEEVEKLIREGLDVNTTNAQGRSPLHLAAEKGDILLTKLLLENGAWVDGPADTQATPLYLAMDKDHLELAQLLVESGAEVNAKWPNSSAQGRSWTIPMPYTPLYWAVRKNAYALAEALLAKGANMHARNGALGASPLSQAAGQNSLALCRLLVSHGVNINLGSHFHTPLQLAARSGYAEIVKELLTIGAQRPDPARWQNCRPDIKQLFEEASAVPQLRALCLAVIHEKEVDTTHFPKLLLNFNE